jgi:hypothetical protein
MDISGRQDQAMFSSATIQPVRDSTATIEMLSITMRRLAP